MAQATLQDCSRASCPYRVDDLRKQILSALSSTVSLRSL